MPDNELTFEEMVEFLSEEIFGHLGLSDGDDVYVVPINHTYSDGEILMHCALEGRKLDMIRASSAACFEVSRMIGVPVPHGPKSCDEPFKSVICRGTARVIDDIDERVDVLNRFQDRYNTDEVTRAPITAERAAKCGAIAMKVERMTGRFWAGKASDRRCDWRAE